jgi:hypothetical protein
MPVRKSNKNQLRFMLKYLDLENEWHTLDLMAVKEIYPKELGCMTITMKDGSWIVAQLMKSV